MKPDISILIANYNNGHYFKEAYRSLLNQTFENWEAVVIDDCSTDSSVEVIRRLTAGDLRFRFYQNSANTGYQNTIIRAISLAEAEIFGRLDPDDMLAPRAIELSLAAHIGNPEAGLVYSDLALCDSRMAVTSIHKSHPVAHLDESYYNLQGEIAPFCTFKKSFYNRTSGLDATLRRAEDKDIYMKMCEVAPVVYVPEVLYHYRHHTGSLSTGGNEFRALFWHWVALVKMMDRRHADLEEVFIRQIVKRSFLDGRIRLRDWQMKWLSDTVVGRMVAAALGKNIY